MECEAFQSLATGGTVDSYSKGGFAVCHFLPQRLQAIVLCENEEVSGVGGARPGQTEADTISWCLVADTTSSCHRSKPFQEHVHQHKSVTVATI